MQTSLVSVVLFRPGKTFQFVLNLRSGNLLALRIRIYHCIGVLSHEINSCMWMTLVSGGTVEAWAWDHQLQAFFGTVECNQNRYSSRDHQLYADVIGVRGTDEVWENFPNRVESKFHQLCSPAHFGVLVCCRQCNERSHIFVVVLSTILKRTLDQTSSLTCVLPSIPSCNTELYWRNSYSTLGTWSWSLRSSER